MIRLLDYVALYGIPILKDYHEYNFATADHLTITMNHTFDGVLVVSYEPKATRSVPTIIRN